MILKVPTWKSLTPGLPHYAPVSDNTAKALRAIIDIPGQYYQAFFDDMPVNFYKIEDNIHQKKYFVKCVPQASHESYHQAEHIARWLKAQNVNVSATLKVMPSLDGLVHYYIYDLLEGIRLPSTHSALTSLGHALAKLHQSLQNYPLRQTLICNTKHRLSVLNDIRQKIIQQELSLGPFPEYVKYLASHAGLSFEEGHDVQILHGDLNPGNLLHHDRDIYFLDFEDTLHSALPVIYELAYIIERSILTRISDPTIALDLGKNFMRAYLDSGGHYRPHKNDKNALLSLALRSFCVLSLCELEGKVIPTSEWFKFYKLSQLTAQNNDLFQKMVRL